MCISTSSSTSTSSSSTTKQPKNRSLLGIFMCGVVARAICESIFELNPKWKDLRQLYQVYYTESNSWYSTSSMDTATAGAILSNITRISIHDDLQVRSNFYKMVSLENEQEPIFLDAILDDFIYETSSGDIIQNHKQPTIFTCTDNGNAIGELKAVFMDVLPECRFVSLYRIGMPRYNVTQQYKWLFHHLQTHSEDIFLGRLGFQCRTPQIHQWLDQRFEGKLVVTSGEDLDYHKDATFRKRMEQKPNKTYFLGPIRHPEEDNNNKIHGQSLQTMQLYYLQLIYWFYIRHQGQFSRASANVTDIPPFLPLLSSHASQHQHVYHEQKQHFLIYANSNCVDFREQAFDRLSQMGMVHYSGKCSGTTTTTTTTAAAATTTTSNRSNKNKTKVTFPGVRLATFWENTKHFGNYRFCLVMEHSQFNGYITEKILLAFASGCIPIYYGTEQIFDIFRDKAFIYYNVSDPEPALERIQYLEIHPKVYNDMMMNRMQDPLYILADGEATVAKYFSFHDRVGGGTLKARIRHFLGVQ